MGYTIRSIRETGTITYYCSTPQNALEKVQDFQRADYRDITIAQDNDRRIPEIKLISIVDSANRRPIQSSCF